MHNFITLPDGEIVNLSHIVAIEQIDERESTSMKASEPEHMRIHLSTKSFIRVKPRHWDELWDILRQNGLDNYQDKTTC